MHEEQQKENILILDDDPVYRKLSRSILNERFNVYTAELPSLAFNILKTASLFEQGAVFGIS